MMIEYNEEGKLLLQNTPIVNTKTQSKYISDDMEVVDIDGEKYLNSKYSFNKVPPKIFKLENWEVLTQKEPSEINVLERNIVSLNKLKITPETNSFNIMLIMYLKEMAPNNSLITTNATRLKHLLNKLINFPDDPISWKFTIELLEYVSSNMDMFLQWMSGEKAQGILNKYLKI